MGTILLHFTLTAVNLFSANYTESMGKNPRLQYFIAGITFGFGLEALIRFLLK